MRNIIRLAATTQPSPEDNAAMQALSEAGAMCGDCGDEPGDRKCPNCERCLRWYVAALRTAGWAPVADLQQQIDKATNELAAIKKDLATLQHTVTGVPR
ncbi:hypothetical protein AB0G67_40170 [Streptomyces sp. NPDC021056]|uniref:hypothetical protein n=1 Tax=Streptomyces sp. NPDC021056 TaxID=3155012 RepID=UPI0033FF01A2